MSIVRPKIFLDTGICINVANGIIDPAEWRRVQKWIASRYRYVISFITLKELLIKLARGSDAYFEQNKRPLRVLWSPANRSFLPYPAVLALRTALGMRSVARSDDSGMIEEQWAKTVLGNVLKAPNKAALKRGIKVRNQRGSMWTFDLDHFDTHENSPQMEHAQLLEGIRDGNIEMPKPNSWAAWILHQFGITPLTEDCEKLGLSLDAAFRFSVALSEMAKNRSYDFTAHASDWGDALQLYYLCDARMHLLTLDADFRNRTKGSVQGSRILLYSEFVRSIRSEVS